MGQVVETWVGQSRNAFRRHRAVIRGVATISLHGVKKKKRMSRTPPPACWQYNSFISR